MTWRTIGDVCVGLRIWGRSVRGLRGVEGGDSKLETEAVIDRGD